MLLGAVEDGFTESLYRFLCGREISQSDFLAHVTYYLVGNSVARTSNPNMNIFYQPQVNQ